MTSTTSNLSPELQQRLADLRQRLVHLRAEHPNSVLTQIGNTPMLSLPYENPNIKLWAKLDSYNPSSSVKDRTALYLVADAMEQGGVTPETTLVEASSGNTGIGLAMICAVLKQKALIYMADDASIERRHLISAYGAEIKLTPGELGTTAAIDAARAKNEEDGFYWIAQHENKANILAHYDSTGPEILNQCPDIDVFVACSGTTGTLVGASSFIKETRPNLKVVSVWPKTKIMGIRRPDGDCKPIIYDDSWIDHIVEIEESGAKAGARALANQTGMLMGPTAGAAWLATRRWLDGLEDTSHIKNVVLFFPDDGVRYLSTDTFHEDGYGKDFF